MTSPGATPVTPAVLLRARRVGRLFGDFTAVQEVTMSVGPGEVVGLLGANGAGKTTLIRMLLGLIATTTGDVELLGGPPDRELRRRLGYVPQGLGLYRDLTVAENLAFTSQAYEAVPPELPETLRPAAGRLVAELPLGLQRQLAFLCALAHHPEVLVLDEPTSGVDVLARAALWDTIHEQAEEGVAVRTSDWARAFAVLNEAGQPVMLAGRDVRVADADADQVRAVLTEAGVSAEVVGVPATIEERMMVLARASEGP